MSSDGLLDFPLRVCRKGEIPAQHHHRAPRTGKLARGDAADAMCSADDYGDFVHV